MSVDLGSVNWLAVLIGTLACFALDAIWFAPATPIGRAWMKAAASESPTNGTLSITVFYAIPDRRQPGHGHWAGAIGGALGVKGVGAAGSAEAAR